MTMDPGHLDNMVATSPLGQDSSSSLQRQRERMLPENTMDTYTYTYSSEPTLIHQLHKAFYADSPC